MNFFNQISPSKLLEPSYIFEKTPESTGLYKSLAIVFALMIIAAIVLLAKAKKKERFYKKLSLKFVNLLFVTGIIGLVLLFFRWQGIPYLGSRFFLLVLLGFVIIYLANIGYYKLFILPREIEKQTKKANYEKYLP